jgi:adenylate cyclase, class 2
VSAGPVETEVKLRMADAAAARSVIAAVGAEQICDRLFEANMVYDTPSGDIRAKGQLLRVRQVGERCVLTWKGPGSPGKHKSREETELLLSDCDAFDRILRQLGYAPVFRYEKYRTEFALNGGTITLDETPIGCFIELEGTPEWIDETARRMNLDESEYITDSYATLHTQYCVQAGVERGWMTFPANS